MRTQSPSPREVASCRRRGTVRGFGEAWAPRPSLRRPCWHPACVIVAETKNQCSSADRPYRQGLLSRGGDRAHAGCQLAMYPMLL